MNIFWHFSRSENENEKKEKIKMIIRESSNKIEDPDNPDLADASVQVCFWFWLS